MWTEEQRQKARERMLGANNPFYGKKHSAEAIEKCRLANLGNKYHLGKKVSAKGRDKMRTAQLSGKNWMRGRGKEQHPNWKNGIHRGKHVGKDYEDWRKSVFERDDYTCHKCWTKGGRINAHHIKSWAKHPERRFEKANGITLCIPCHKQVHSQPI